MRQDIGDRQPNVFRAHTGEAEDQGQTGAQVPAGGRTRVIGPLVAAGEGRAVRGRAIEGDQLCGHRTGRVVAEARRRRPRGGRRGHRRRWGRRGNGGGWGGWGGGGGGGGSRRRPGGHVGRGGRRRG